HAAAAANEIPAELLALDAQVTDCNAAIFDAANGFHGVIAGCHEILRRQGLLEGIWCLDPKETLGPGQRQEIDRVCAAYPHLNDEELGRLILGGWRAGVRWGAAFNVGRSVVARLNWLRTRACPTMPAKR